MGCAVCAVAVLLVALAAGVRARLRRDAGCEVGLQLSCPTNFQPADTLDRYTVSLFNLGSLDSSGDGHRDQHTPSGRHYTRKHLNWKKKEGVAGIYTPAPAASRPRAPQRRVPALRCPQADHHPRERHAQRVRCERGAGVRRPRPEQWGWVSRRAHRRAAPRSSARRRRRSRTVSSISAPRWWARTVRPTPRPAITPAPMSNFDFASAKYADVPDT